MTGSYTNARASLWAALKRDDVKVIAVRGRWGTGKTYIWRSVEPDWNASRPRPKIRDILRKLCRPEAAFSRQGWSTAWNEYQIWRKTGRALYASLFGVQSAKDLKLKLAARSDRHAWRFVKTLLAKIVDTAAQWFGGVSTHDIASEFASIGLRDKLIVIDDIERKHEGLDINELLGFVEEFTDLYDSKFILILNPEGLKTSGLWDDLREKVIDAEVALRPTPIECFDIASAGEKAPFTDAARRACEVLALTNIRVIRRILRTLRDLYKIRGAQAFPPERLVSSVALITASFLRAPGIVPPYESVCKFDIWGMHAGLKTNKDATGADASDGIRLDEVLEKLGIQYADELEPILQSYIEDGALDQDSIGRLFARYAFQQDSDAALEGYKSIFRANRWDKSATTESLINRIRELKNLFKNLKPRHASELIALSEELGDSHLAAEIRADAISSIRAGSIDGEDYSDPIPKGFDREITEAIRESRSIALDPTLNQMHQAIQRVISRSWSSREMRLLSNFSASGYESAIRHADPDQLADLFSTFREWNEQEKIPHELKPARQNFQAACKSIIDAEPQTRLAMIIRREFEASSARQDGAVT